MADDDSPIRTDEHLIALRGMWEEMKLLGRKIDRTNDRLDAVRTDLSARIDRTNDRLDAVRTDLSARIDAVSERIDGVRTEFVRVLADADIRLSTELLAVRQTLDGLNALLRERFASQAELLKLRERVDRLEQRLPP